MNAIAIAILFLNFVTSNGTLVSTTTVQFGTPEACLIMRDEYRYEYSKAGTTYPIPQATCTDFMTGRAIQWNSTGTKAFVSKPK